MKRLMGRSCRPSEVEANRDVAGVCEARRQQHILRRRTVVWCAGNKQIPTCCMNERGRSQTECSKQLMWDTSELLQKKVLKANV